jgi:hypothetical protein
MSCAIFFNSSGFIVESKMSMPSEEVNGSHSETLDCVAGILPVPVLHQRQLDGVINSVIVGEIMLVSLVLSETENERKYKQDLKNAEDNRWGLYV